MMPLRALTISPRDSRPGTRSCDARHGGVVERDPALVLLAGDRGEPSLVVEIPAHGAGETGFEGLGRRPAELAPDLRRVDCVATVVSRAILHEANLRGVVAPGPEFSQDAAERAHDVQVGLLGAAADVVGFARAAPLQHGPDRRAVVP